MRSVPIYLFTGFLESGKTKLINETVRDESFHDGSRTLILACEEGIEEYDEKELQQYHCRVIPVEDLPGGLGLENLRTLDETYAPERVMIEYNGTWSVTEWLNSAVPKGWEIAQIVATADASTFESYVANMRSLMFEQLRYADLIIFNRCSSKVRKSFLRANVRSYNRSAQLIYENVDGQIEEMGEEELPFDASRETIEIAPDDYGIWYLDALDHAKKYEGKTIRFAAMAFPVEQFGKPIVAVGRYAMVCCEKDKAFMGIGVVDQDGRKIRKGDWVRVEGKIRIDYDPASNQDYISLWKSTLTPCRALDDPYVIF